MQNTIVVTIGRNIGDEPMLPAMWDQFKRDVLYVLEECGATIIQRPNFTESPDAVGCWEGQICEEAAAFVAFIPEARQQTPVPHLRNVAAKYSQDAIGWITAEGTDNLIRPTVPGTYGSVNPAGFVIGV